jgi:hypothetical protein
LRPFVGELLPTVKAFVAPALFVGTTIMSLKVAHIREQGVDMIIVPLDSGFGRKMQTEQDQIIGAIQRQATAAGLAGWVVPVWDDCGRLAFRAPSGWHPFFRSVNLPWVYANLNRVLH